MTTDNRTNEPRRLKSCVERWPECETGEYNPSCCRFPKSCSATVYSEEHVTEDDLEPPAALVAAQGAARPVNSFDTTAERKKNGADSLHVTPQEPLALDPEKVADVLRLAMRAEAMMFEDGGYEWIAESDPDDCLPHIARALCEAYTEGKLTK